MAVRLTLLPAQLIQLFVNIAKKWVIINQCVVRRQGGSARRSTQQRQHHDVAPIQQNNKAAGVSGEEQKRDVHSNTYVVLLIGVNAPEYSNSAPNSNMRDACTPPMMYLLLLHAVPCVL